MLSIPGDWANVLRPETQKPYWKQLEDFLIRERKAATVYPPAHEVFRAFELTSFRDTRVVLLGQDPYFRPLQANGLCFSVGPNVVRLPPSLKSIQRLLDVDHPSSGGRVASGDLSAWAEQGVLLLNTVLTVREGAPDSHRRQGWEDFTDAVISALETREDPPVYVLWGRKAQRKVENKVAVINDSSRVVCAPHPAARGEARQPFLDSRTFSKVDSKLQGLPIDWRR